MRAVVATLMLTGCGLIGCGRVAYDAVPPDGAGRDDGGHDAGDAARRDGGPDADAGSPSSLLGELDPRFGDGGHFWYAGPGGADELFGIDVDPAGRLVVSGITWTGGGERVRDGLVLRVRLDTGALDPTLNGTGVISVNQLGWDIWTGGVHAVGIDEFVVGATIDDQLRDDPTVWKLAADGSFDATWGELGGYTRAGTPGESGSYGFAVDSLSGDYLVVGASWSDGNAYVARFAPDGSRSRTFGSGGIVLRNDYPSSRNIGVFADAREGTVYATGYGDGATTRDMVLYRFLADGSLDRSFAGVGHLTHDGAGGAGSADRGNHVLVGADGTIAVIGTTTSETSPVGADAVVWKFLPDGTLASSFAIGGVLRLDGPAGSNDEAHSGIFGSDGSLYVAGATTTSAGGQDLAVWKVDWEHGRVDSSFAAGGVLVDDAYGEGLSDLGRRMLLLPDGRLAIAGHATSVMTGRDAAVWIIR